MNKYSYKLNIEKLQKICENPYSRIFYTVKDEMELI